MTAGEPIVLKNKNDRGWGKVLQRSHTVNGWKIYQLSYNEQMGKWSNISVFELVRDPWLHAVYVGIYLLIIGAVGMFLTAGKKKEK